MKKTIAFICAFAFFISLSAQSIEGTYKNGTDSLKFSNGKATFSLSGFGALFTQTMGEGTYEQIGEFILVHTTDYSHDKTTVESKEIARKDTTTLEIMSIDGFMLDGVLAELLNKSGKTILRGVTNGSGNIYILKNDKVTQIRVSNLGYDGIVFDYDFQKDYTIRMAKNEIVENQTVAFRIKPSEEDIISVILLTDNFDPGKDRDKALEKLVKQVEKKNILDKRMRKEYIPIYGR